MRIRDPQTRHRWRAGRSTRSRSGGTRAEVRAIPHLPQIQRCLVPDFDAALFSPEWRDLIETVIVPRARDLGSFAVRRALPSAQRQMVGPFIFFDQMGPSEFLLGAGMDVRPHPHIGLSTVTYLFDGEIMHRDSLGTELPIRPGELNWMTAGRGIVHSERTAQELRTTGSKLFGIQSWVALSAKDEEASPGFVHYDAGEMPVLTDEGKT